MMPLQERPLEYAAAAIVVLTFALAGCSRSQAAPRPDTESSALGTSARRDPAVTASEAGPPRPFGAPCVTDAECAAGACFHRHAHGATDAGHDRRGKSEGSEGTADPVEADGYCSIRCSDDGECPVPPTSGRCGGRGMCKK